MNKKTIITALLSLVTLTGWAQTNKYTIHGNFTKVAEVMSKQGLSFDSVTLVNPATPEVVARQSIQNGMFTIQGTPLNDILSDVVSKRNAPDFIETVKDLLVQHKSDKIPYPQIINLQRSSNMVL